jgi:hypothetical protein
MRTVESIAKKGLAEDCGKSVEASLLGCVHGLKARPLIVFSRITISKEPLRLNKISTNFPSGGSGYRK